MIPTINIERVPASNCPNCGKLCDAVTRIEEDATPSPGDFTICLDCKHLMVFADDLTLRNPTDAEIVEAAGDPEILATQRFVQRYRKTSH
jgi:hypothetical protein